MKSIASTLAATLVLASAMFASDIRQKRYNLENDSLAIQGYDPVSYFSGDPKEGDPSLLYEYKGVAYQFANEANLNAFKANPKKYEPKYGGWCAYAMLDGDRTDINPETYKIIGDKLYLYYNGFWGNTLKKWKKMLGQKTESELVQQADNAWKEIVSN